MYIVVITACSTNKAKKALLEILKREAMARTV